MNRNKLLTLLGGVVFTSYAIYALFSGSIGGIGVTGGTNMVFRDEQPIYYWLSELVVLTGGLMLIYSAFENK